MEIQLRQLTLDDAEHLFPIWNDNEIIQYTYHPYMANQEVCRRKIMDILGYNRKIKYSFGPFVILYETKVIGLIGLEFVSKALKEYELWYILSKNHWGKGLAETAVKELLQKAFREMDIERLYAEVVPENTASWKVLEKNGFKREGCLRKKFIRDGKTRDLFVYSIIKEEYNL